MGGKKCANLVSNALAPGLSIKVTTKRFHCVDPEEARGFEGRREEKKVPWDG